MSYFEIAELPSCRLINFYGKDFRTDQTFRDAGDGTGHANGKIIPNLNLDDATRTMNGYTSIYQAQFMRHCGRGSAAAGKCVPGAALPDLDLDIRAINDFQELHIGFAREICMRFQQRSKFMGQ